MAVYTAMYNLISLLDDIGASNIIADYKDENTASILFGIASNIHIFKKQDNKVEILFYAQNTIKSFVCDANDTKQMYETLWSKEENLFELGKKLSDRLQEYEFPELKSTSWNLHSFKITGEEKHYMDVFIVSKKNIGLRLRDDKGKICYCPSFSCLKHLFAEIDFLK